MPVAMSSSGPVPRRRFLAQVAGAVAGLAAGMTGGAAPGRSLPASSEPNPSPASHPEAAVAGPRPPSTLDLLVRGGRLVDPGLGLDGAYDVGIRDGRVVEVAPGISTEDVAVVLEADGRLVTPGFIDLHTHLFPGVSHFGIEPDPNCVHRGVTSALDTGSAGAATFRGFEEHVLSRSATRIRTMLNISVLGMISNLRGELQSLEYADVGEAVSAIEGHSQWIAGVKVRAGWGQSGTNDLAAVQRARAVAEATSRPMMMHITTTATPIEELLSLLRPGDILTHAFRRSGTPEAAREGILTGEGLLRPEARAALERGVIFDVGHGSTSFSFVTMERALEQGVLPSTISSDLHSYSVHGPVFDQATTISKLIALGLSVDEAVYRTTTAAADAVEWGARIGSLDIGSEADVALFDLREGSHRFVDSHGVVRTGSLRLIPWKTVKEGRVFDAPTPP